MQSRIRSGMNSVPYETRAPLPPRNTADDFEVTAWINATKNGKAFTVKDAKTGQLIGFVAVASIERLLEGKIKGSAVKIPKGGLKNPEGVA